MAHRILQSIRNNPSIFFSYSYSHSQQTPSQYRSIFATSHLDGAWMDKIKGVFTGKKPTSDSPDSTEESFTLDRFADELGKARKLGTLKQYVVGRSSEATFADAFAKQEEILRYLGNFDPNGQNLQISQKQAAAKQCKCTMADVENTLAKYTWAKEAQFKLQKLKEEGKPMPKSMAEDLNWWNYQPTSRVLVVAALGGKYVG
ncbi:uncharacterized protein LOC104890978 isoform X2 [Beta vulgaris subsp. vulgaris]|uniref:uncharacterized protein LOC104890978 isoform X2 n=1 Tax=Beta vulgaris subsp. vulgaris TaxID=3555 RepID=UPI002036AA39|nr:uncharacterized protein LOC104890978 isoform X2 [Beta vulgaris subsp. vulgaris]